MSGATEEEGGVSTGSAESYCGTGLRGTRTRRAPVSECSPADPRGVPVFGVPTPISNEVPDGKAGSGDGGYDDCGYAMVVWRSWLKRDSVVSEVDAAEYWEFGCDDGGLGRGESWSMSLYLASRKADCMGDVCRSSVGKKEEMDSAFSLISSSSALVLPMSRM